VTPGEATQHFHVSYPNQTTWETALLKLEEVRGDEARRSAAMGFIALQPAARNLREVISLDIDWFNKFDLSRSWSLEVLQLDSSVHERASFTPACIRIERIAEPVVHQFWEGTTIGRSTKAKRTAPKVAKAPPALHDGAVGDGEEGEENGDVGPGDAILSDDELSSCGSGSDDDWWHGRAVYDDLGVHCLVAELMGEDVVAYQIL
jgi:hypothetical protein